MSSLLQNVTNMIHNASEKVDEGVQYAELIVYIVFGLMLLCLLSYVVKALRCLRCIFCKPIEYMRLN